MAKVLIADDEANLRKVLRALLEHDGHTTVAVADGLAAKEEVKRGNIDLVITDLKMPRMSGLELLEAVHRDDPGLPVIVITAHGSVDTAVSALKSGAFDYITKPFDKDELRLAVRKAAALRAANENSLLDEGDAAGRFQIIGRSPRMRTLYDVIEKVANTPSTVLIIGESGTGKELVASALHENSDRRNEPLIRVNCAAIPKDLLESEFFGYEQGAFTGAISAKPGRFELADGGTLFLDEIAEIPIGMQVKLLRALQESEFERVGGVRTQRVDVRVIAATNRDLLQEIERGNFREDLYYRLNVVPIALPALRERKEDIPLLAEHFIHKHNKRLNRNVAGVSKDALAILMQYPWPGNIRELENVVERTLLFAEDETITPDEVPEDIRQPPHSASAVAHRFEHTLTDFGEGSASMRDIVRAATSEIEKDLITKALEETQGNVTRAAHLLRISRKGLQNKMKELGLREPEGKNS